MLTDNIYNGWKISDNTIKSKKDPHLVFEFKKWIDFANKLLNKQIDNYKPTFDWQVLGSFIIQTIFQRDCDSDNTIEQLNKFSFDITNMRLDKCAKSEELPTLKKYDNKDYKITNKWLEESNYGYFISHNGDEEKIWYGYIYTPIYSEGFIQVLAIKCYEYNKYFFYHPRFKKMPFKNLTPIGVINRNEGWYYFKIKDETNIDEAVRELKAFTVSE